MAVLTQPRLAAVPPQSKESSTTSRITPLDLLQLNRKQKGETQTDRSVRSLTSVLSQMSQAAQKNPVRKPEVAPARLREIDASKAAAELTRVALFENRRRTREPEVDEVSVLLAVLG
ncbi:MAG: hypothetical protein U0136_07360 [Bdellovibrionota bacterium]